VFDDNVEDDFAERCVFPDPVLSFFFCHAAEVEDVFEFDAFFLHEREGERPVFSRAAERDASVLDIDFPYFFEFWFCDLVDEVVEL